MSICVRVLPGRCGQTHTFSVFMNLVGSYLAFAGGTDRLSRNVEGKVCKYMSILFLFPAAVFLIILFPCSGCFVSLVGDIDQA